jgi:hypothetical protein
MMTCRCGGQLRLDLSHISQAQRFGCLATARLLWKCCLCGHALWLDQSALVQADAPAEAEVSPVA